MTGLLKTSAGTGWKVRLVGRDKEAVILSRPIRSNSHRARIQNKKAASILKKPIGYLLDDGSETFVDDGVKNRWRVLSNEGDLARSLYAIRKDPVWVTRLLGAPPSMIDEYLGIETKWITLEEVTKRRKERLDRKHRNREARALRHSLSKA